MLKSLIINKSSIQTKNAFKKIYSNFIIIRQLLPIYIFIINIHYSYCETNINPITNIISFNEYVFSFLSTSLNGDLILTSTKDFNSPYRLFFGLTKDGEYFFKDENNKEVSAKELILKNDNGENIENYYSLRHCFYKINDSTNTLYLISHGVYKYYTEIYELNSNNIETKLITQSFNVNGNYLYYAEKSNIIMRQNNNQIEYLYFINTIVNENWDTYYINYLRYHFEGDSIKFNDENLEIGQKLTTTRQSRTISSFITESQLIIVFHRAPNSYYTIIVFNSTLNIVNTITTEYHNEINEHYSQCIHLKKEIGVFILYDNNNSNYEEHLILKKFDTQYYNATDLFNIKLDLPVQIDFSLNSLHKLKDNWFIYATSSNDYYDLYINVFSLYNNDQNLKMRIFKIEFHEYFNFRFFKVISLANYNDHLALCTSLCDPEGNGECDKTKAFTYLIIFNYINNTGTNINLADYYSKDNNFIMNVSDIIKVENNIFGFELNKLITITSIPDEIELYKISNTDTETKLNNNDEIDITNYKLKINEKNNTIKTSDYYYIKYKCEISDASYDKFESIAYDKTIYGQDTTQTDNTLYESDFKNTYKRNGKIKFKLCYEFCNSCNFLGFSNEDQKCTSCISGYELDESSNCILEEKSSNESNDTKCSLSKPYLIKSTNKCSSICTTNEILNSDCFLDYSSQETLINTYNLLFNISKNNNGVNAIIETKDDFIFQLTNTSNEYIQSYNKENELSSVILGECETLLKKAYNIDDNLSLLILKVEKIDSKTNAKNVQYEIYHPINKTQLDLSYCSETTIDILIPKRIDNKTLSLFEDLKNKGYDLFNPNDSFYNDICSKYTSENSTDVTLSDRKNDFYINDTEVYCQDGCVYKNYDTETQTYRCTCSVNSDNINLNKEFHFNGLIIISSFYDVIKFSNIAVMKCFKLVFSLEGQKGNIGSYIVIFLGVAYFIFSGIFLFTGLKKIEQQMVEIIKSTFHFIKKKASKISKKSKSFSKINQKDFGTNDINNLQINIYKARKNNSNPPEKIKKKKKKKKKKKNSLIDEPSSISKIESWKKKNSSKLIESQNTKLAQISKDQIKFIVNDINKIDNNENEFNFGKNGIEINEPIAKSRKLSFSEYELNELNYLDALKYDKRTFYQYYWSLCKKEHLILFTFIACKDYNLTCIKLVLFSLSLSLDFTINCFFFNDDSMHKIYMDYGEYNFISEIPQMIYSTVISEIFDILVKSLALSEGDVYQIKNAKNKIEVVNLSKKILKKIKIKLGIFFGISILLMFFCWYFIAAFCAVYSNTQFTFIKDSFGSFVISLIYPFGLYMIPAVLRIVVLRDPKKNKECLFKFSNVLPIV